MREMCPYASKKVNLCSPNFDNLVLLALVDSGMQYGKISQLNKLLETVQNKHEHKQKLTRDKGRRLQGETKEEQCVCTASLFSLIASPNLSPEDTLLSDPSLRCPLSLLQSVCHWSSLLLF